MLLDRCQIIQSKLGKQSCVLVREGYQVQKILYMLDQLRTTGYSRNQNIAGGKGGVLICVSLNINYSQRAAKGGFEESNLFSGLAPVCRTDSPHVRERSLSPPHRSGASF